jgi:(E)-4-hydroxy-3-methylbut-2-enyl-diphosphate synthase
VFIDGKKAMTLRGANIAAEFKAIVEDYVARRYAEPGGAPQPADSADAST